MYKLAQFVSREYRVSCELELRQVVLSSWSDRHIDIDQSLLALFHDFWFRVAEFSFQISAGLVHRQKIRALVYTYFCPRVIFTGEGLGGRLECRQLLCRCAREVNVAKHDGVKCDLVLIGFRWSILRGEGGVLHLA